MTDAHDTSTLGDLVAANPAAARILDRFGLDYCCHGDRTLADACAASGVDPAVVAAKLADSRSRATPRGPRSTHLPSPTTSSPPTTGTCGRSCRCSTRWPTKVLAVHGERHPELDEVRQLVAALRADLEPHLLKEERVLFPAIAALAGGQREFPFGSVANPIRMMLAEHDRAGELLARLRTVTGDYTAPPDGCASYRSLYERLGRAGAGHARAHPQGEPRAVPRRASPRG